MITPVPKVICYITWQGRLLVFTQPQRPDQGVQVPGGTIEPGEAPAAAALREAREESGLTHLSVAAYLGTALYELQVDTGPPHSRHFFHLLCSTQPPEHWQHEEPATSVRPFGQRRDFHWEALQSTCLDWEMGVYLGGVRSALLRG